MKILASFVAFYTLGALVGALFAMQYFPITVQLVIWKVALWCAAISGFTAAYWLWRQSRRAPLTLRIFGISYLGVAWIIPFLLDFPNRSQLLVAEFLGSILSIILILWLARWVERQIAGGVTSA